MLAVAPRIANTESRPPRQEVVLVNNLLLNRKASHKKNSTGGGLACAQIPKKSRTEAALA